MLIREQVKTEASTAKPMNPTALPLPSTTAAQDYSPNSSVAPHLCPPLLQAGVVLGSWAEQEAVGWQGCPQAVLWTCLGLGWLAKLFGAAGASKCPVQEKDSFELSDWRDIQPESRDNVYVHITWPRPLYVATSTSDLFLIFGKSETAGCVHSCPP